MNDKPIHRLYRHFQELPTSMRTLFTGALLVVGLGYPAKEKDGHPRESLPDEKIHRNRF